MKPKKRILHERLAAVVASLRHGEMLFIADAGSGTSSKALYPLDSSVEYIDVAIVTEDMIEVNQKDYQLLVDLLGKKNIHSMHYIPEYYEMRDRCKAVVQTGDYGVHAQAILIAGYPSAEISMKWLKEGIKGK